MESHDFPFRVDRLDLGLLGVAARVGHVNRREDAIFQDKAVLETVNLIGVISYNRAGVVDSFADRERRVGHIECREVAFSTLGYRSFNAKLAGIVRGLE